MKAEAPAFSEAQFPCANCGALQAFAPGSEALRCPYCGHSTPIARSESPIVEFDFRAALAALAEADGRPGEPPRRVIHCDACGSSFEFDRDIHAGECPYCATPVVLGSEYKDFRPQSLLPFGLDAERARTEFRDWLGGLWFAPGDLQEYARGEARLTGVYVPYWTYDSHTTTRYRGERGDYYQVPEQYVTMIKGRRVTRTRMVTRVRWTPAAGTVTRYFDDVLVGASTSLPRQITDRLEPWDLAELVPFQKEYLSGFSSQVYQVGLDEGFERARRRMDNVIRNDIARDIGGDVQRIHTVETRHRDTTFKHLLLPVWTAAFRYRGRDFLFVVNGRTGKVAGERPYSVWKIISAILFGIVLAGGLWWYAQQGTAAGEPGFGWPPPTRVIH